VKSATPGLKEMKLESTSHFAAEAMAPIPAAVSIEITNPIASKTIASRTKGLENLSDAGSMRGGKHSKLQSKTQLEVGDGRKTTAGRSPKVAQAGTMASQPNTCR
jgi:hypothetical protein